MAGQGSRWAWGVAILAIALGCRLAAGVWWQQRLPADQSFAFGDSHGYWHLGQALARGEPFQYGSPDARIFRTPGYPVLLAALFRVLGDDDPSVLWGRALSAVLGTIAVGGVMMLAWQLSGWRAAVLASGIAALHPEAVSLGTFVLSEAPFSPLMAWQLAAWLGAWNAVEKPESRRRAIGLATLAGVLAGLATLMRPSWLLFTPFALILTLVLPEARRRHRVLAIPLLLGLAVVMSPWWWRNYQITHRLVLTTLQVGASLYDGLSPQATGASDMRFVPEFQAAQRAADASADASEAQPLVGTFEERLDRRLRDASLAWVRAHPDQAARLAVVKFLRMWNVVPNSSEMGGRLLRVVVAIGYVVVMAAAIFGSGRLSRTTTPIWLFWMPALYLTCLHVIFVSSIRYRQPTLLPLMAVGAAAVVAWRRSAPMSELPS